MRSSKIFLNNVHLPGTGPLSGKYSKINLKSKKGGVNPPSLFIFSLTRI
jgi:hypothetical protein